MVAFLNGIVCFYTVPVFKAKLEIMWSIHRQFISENVKVLRYSDNIRYPSHLIIHECEKVFLTYY